MREASKGDSGGGGGGGRGLNGQGTHSLKMFWIWCLSKWSKKHFCNEIYMVFHNRGFHSNLTICGNVDRFIYSFVIKN